MKNNYIKVIDKRLMIPHIKGGGIVKFEVWKHNNNIVKYNMLYINRNIFIGDNGRVVGYDNAHNFHHKHYFGQISEVDDFISYENLVKRFKQDIKEFIC